MDVLEAIRKRRAVRHYTDEPVEPGQVRRLLELAVQAPSAMNEQPWAFAVIQSRALLEDYSRRARTHLLQTVTNSPEWDRARDLLQQPEFNIFYNAGTLIVICARPDGVNPAEDCCLAAENLMLAACALGLATCPIGFARAWLNLPETRREFGIPAKYQPVFPLIVGYAAGEQEAPPRREPEVVAWK